MEFELELENLFQNFLVKLDRGEYFRNEEQVMDLFNSNFEVETRAIHRIKLFGLVTGWNVLTLLMKRVSKD